MCRQPARPLLLKEEQGIVAADLRATVVFTVQDVRLIPVLADRPGVMPQSADLLVEAQAKVISMFHFALRAGGVLLWALRRRRRCRWRFELIAKSERLYRTAELTGRPWVPDENRR